MYPVLLNEGSRKKDSLVGAQGGRRGGGTHNHTQPHNDTPSLNEVVL